MMVFTKNKPKLTFATFRRFEHAVKFIKKLPESSDATFSHKKYGIDPRDERFVVNYRKVKREA
jgi:hypothetical protein